MLQSRITVIQDKNSFVYDNQNTFMRIFNEQQHQKKSLWSLAGSFNKLADRCNPIMIIRSFN